MSLSGYCIRFIRERIDILLKSVYRQISFLTGVYREAMILFYLDGLSTAEIAKIQNISEAAFQIICWENGKWQIVRLKILECFDR